MMNQLMSLTYHVELAEEVGPRFGTENKQTKIVCYERLVPEEHHCAKIEAIILDFDFADHA